MIAIVIHSNRLFVYIVHVHQKSLKTRDTLFALFTFKNVAICVGRWIPFRDVHVQRLLSHWGGVWYTLRLHVII